MRRVIGIDIHRTFGEVVIWEDGRLRPVGRIDMTRTALEGFGKKLLATDEVVIEATGNCMAVSRVLDAVREARGDRQSAAGEGDRARPCEDRQDRRRDARQPLCGRLSARDLDAGCGNRTATPAGGAALPGGPPSHADQERGAFDPVRASDPALSARRSVRAPRSRLARPPAAAG